VVHVDGVYLKKKPIIRVDTVDRVTGLRILREWAATYAKPFTVLTYSDGTIRLLGAARHYDLIDSSKEGLGLMVRDVSKEKLMDELETRLLRWFVGENIL
jgi:hypothetical protein